jgi:cytochrome c-type biogenesis protein CcmH/NrfF
MLYAASAAGQAAGEGASGTDGPPNWAYQMAHDLMSPYCPGRTLSACPSPQAAELRQWILLQAAAGQTREEIETSLHEQFGDEILSAPKAEGWGLSAYVVPALGFLLGGGLVVFLLQRLAAPQVEASPQAPRRVAVASAVAAGPPLSDAELERIVDEELAQL